jgi:DNA-directed RNA polymerase alpha subunit
MTDTTKEALLDGFATEAMKALVSRTSERVNLYQLSAEAYIIAERMVERRQTILNQWALTENIVQEGIEKLNLTVRTERGLKAEGILTIQQLQSCTERRLMKIPNLGRKSITEIIEAIAALGYNLKDYI